MIIPYLYSTYANLKSGGGSYMLPDVVSMSVTEERNGAFDLDMQYLYAGENASQIVCEAFIMAVPQRGQAAEPFRIYEVGTPIDGVITVKAHHISYDLDGAVLQPFIKYSLSTVLTEINSQLSSLGFDFLLVNNGITVSSQFSITYPQSAASVLGQGLHSLVGVYGAELSYKWDAANQREVITLNAARGVVSSATVAYGFNLLTLDSKVNSDAVCSDIYPYVKVTENNVTTLVTLPEETIATGATTSRSRTLLVDLSSQFTDVPSENDLRTAAYAYLNSIDWNATQTCSFDFVPLQNTTEYADDTDEQAISLCDTVFVDASVIGVQRTAKVVRTVYNQLSEKYDAMTVGMIEPNIADTIAGLSNNEGKVINGKYLPADGGTVNGSVDVTGDMTIGGELDVGSLIDCSLIYTTNLNIGNHITFEEIHLAGNGSVSITFASSQKKLIVLAGANSNTKEIIIANSNSGGSITHKETTAATGYTYSTSTATLTISNGTTNTIRGFAISF